MVSPGCALVSAACKSALDVTAIVAAAAGRTRNNAAATPDSQGADRRAGGHTLRGTPALRLVGCATGLATTRARCFPNVRTFARKALTQTLHQVHHFSLS